MSIGRLSNLELLELPDCMGLANNGKCTWLNINACRGKGCTFTRSAIDNKSSRIYTFHRLASLSVSKQMHIADK